MDLLGTMGRGIGYWRELSGMSRRQGMMERPSTRTTALPGTAAGIGRFWTEMGSEGVEDEGTVSV
jgi:hypothetical protein